MSCRCHHCDGGRSCPDYEPETEGSGASRCSLCEGMGVLEGFGGGNRTECHKCNGKGKANKETPRHKLCENKSKYISTYQISAISITTSSNRKALPTIKIVQ